MVALHQIVAFLTGAEVHYTDNLLSKNAFVADDDILDIVQNLYDKNCINQAYSPTGDILPISELKIGDNIGRIEFSIYKLKGLFYYVSFQDFVTYCQNTQKPEYYYILDIDSYHDSRNIEIGKLNFVLNFTSALNQICNYRSNDKKTLCISNGNQLEELPIIYNVEDIFLMPPIEDTHFAILDSLTNSRDISSKLYLKELIDFICNIHPNKLRFSYLIKNINDYNKKCICSQEFYVSNFSYNEVKIKIDSAVLDFSRKIQSVINDAQAKLIAIPVALVLAVAAIDFNDVWSWKNIATLLASYIFSWLIDIFLKNQSSALDMIQDNITSYANAFNKGTLLNKEIADSFAVLNQELRKQKNRLSTIKCIVWGVPVLLTIALTFAYGYKLISGISTILALILLIIKNTEK